MTNNKKYYPWIVVALLWGVALLNYMDRQMLSTMKSAMMIDITELESATNFGRLMAVFLWIYGLMSPVAGMMSPVAGMIADRINRKWLIVGSLFVWSFVTLMMGYSTDFNQIYILRAIMGVSEALYIPAGLSLSRTIIRKNAIISCRNPHDRALHRTGIGWLRSNDRRSIQLGNDFPLVRDYRNRV